MKKLRFFCVCLFGFFVISYAEAPVNPRCFEKEKALALLETAENLLTKARTSFPSCKESINLTNKSECNGSKPLAYMEISKKLISDVRRNFPTCPEPVEKDQKIIQDKKPMDCSEILARGHNESGVYTVWIKTGEKFVDGKALQIYCDMNTDKGGWMVIQRRGKFSVQQNFFQDWENYKNGFGNLTEEFWLGNEIIRVLCEKGCEIRFDLQESKGEQRFARYQNFNLIDSNYTLNISGYSGNADDSMKIHNTWGFSTRDQGLTERAKYFHAGWWHRDINYNCNLNGIYQPGVRDYKSASWYAWKSWEGLASVEIKIRPHKN